MTIALIILIGLALIFDFLNGVRDSSNIVATMISSRAINPRAALLMTAVAEFAGPFVFGVALANTIGNEIVESKFLNLNIIISKCCSISMIVIMFRFKLRETTSIFKKRSICFI